MIEEILKEWKRAYHKKPEARVKDRQRAREYYKQPYVKAKAAAYRKKHRALPEVQRQRQQYASEYYKRKKKLKK